MEKQEFLEKLRQALGGKVSPEVMADTMDYYEEYINTELRLGRTSDEVMEALGDPRLIARTIVETKGGKNGDDSAPADGEEYGRSRELRRRLVSIPGWVWLILFFVVVWIIISIVFRVLIKLAPLLLVVSLVVYLYRRFGGED